MSSTEISPTSLLQSSDFDSCEDNLELGTCGEGHLCTEGRGKVPLPNFKLGGFAMDLSDEGEEEENLFIPATKQMVAAKRKPNRVWVYQARFWTKEAATKAAKELLPYNKKKDNNKGVYTWHCTQHKECGMLVQRVQKVDDQGTAFFVVNLSEGQHGSELVESTCQEGSGIPPMWKEHVDTKLFSSVKPKDILDSIRIQVSEQQRLGALGGGELAEINVPSLIQIQTRANTIKRSQSGGAAFKLTTLTELTQHYADCMPPDAESFRALHKDSCTVLAHVTVLDTEKRASEAAVISSPRLFDKVMEAHTEYGDLGMPLVTDGKHKMEACGWVLQPMGTFTRVYDKKKCEFVNKFVPLVFVFAKYEYTAATATARDSIQDWAKRLWGVDLNFCAGLADGARALFAGLMFEREETPSGQLVNETRPFCNPAGHAMGFATDWPHIKRKSISISTTPMVCGSVR
eukprot:TRINITY_DN569_c0_g1_i5.p1 TRINITY_DN569_c0_g1~~TRINITY_DN569_c0_g1_i5.p1  ORF type:complete len:459 (+),score=91.45 TRINITY_DN569_c0_g1_i5:97-1473(+)